MSKQSWKIFLKSRDGKIEFAISFLFLSTVLFWLANFLNFVEMRDGIVLPDPLLPLFSPIDVTWFTFGLIYLSLLIAILYFVKCPGLLMLVIQVYGVMLLFRIAVMYLLPLNPPTSIIPLSDPFVELFGSGKMLTKDLFFSGHTATIFLFFLLSPRGSVKMLFLFFALLVAVAVLIQHVHYSIDVLAAPVFAYTAYRVVLNLRRLFGLPNL